MTQSKLIKINILFFVYLLKAYLNLLEVK